jgi:hypothetical protein
VNLDNESFDGDSLCLTNTMNAHDSLLFHSWIPPWILHTMIITQGTPISGLENSYQDDAQASTLKQIA